MEEGLSTLFFDGDFSIENKDIQILQGTLAVKKQALRDLLITNYRDYYFYPLLGANLDSFIGRGIDISLKEDIEKTIEKAIIDSNLFYKSEFGIYSVVDGNSIIFRIILEEESEEYIQITYNTTVGIKIE